MSANLTQEAQEQPLVRLARKAQAVLVDPPAGRSVGSPCINVCRMTEDRSHCRGCFRTSDDIRVWSQADSATRLAIWRRLLERAGLDEPGAAAR